MDKIELKTDVETLSNEFKAKVSEFFDTKGLNVVLQKLEFSIKKTESEEIGLLSYQKNEVMMTCWINEHGQVECD